MRRDQHPEPFWRAARNCWFVQIGTKQMKLHPDRDEAYRLYHALMSKPPEERQHANPIPSGYVVELLDVFIDWAKKNKAPRTHAWYRENIQRFVDAIPATLTIAELKPYHVTCAMDAFPHWSNNTRHDFISAVKRAFSWALDEEIIDRSPLARMKKPAREAREDALSPDEYAQVMAAVKEPCFRDLLELAWETGARPQELRKLEARFLDLESGRVVFPPKEAKGKKHFRTIYLTPNARRIVGRLAKVNPSGPLLRNSEGNPWKKDAINSAFNRLQLELGQLKMRQMGIDTKTPPRFRSGGVAADQLAEARGKHTALVRKVRTQQTKLARQHGTKYHIGAFRKGYATEALKAGVDTVTVAHLLGHRDPSMISRVYGQVQHDPEHMAASARKAKRVKKSAGA